MTTRTILRNATLGLAGMLVGAAAVTAATITVTTTTDSLAVDGQCSLREAIQAANTDTAVDSCGSGSGADTILLDAGTYTVALAGSDEDDNATGDFDISSSLTLDGSAGATIDAAGLDRALHVMPSPDPAMSVDVTVIGLAITGGDVRGPETADDINDGGGLVADGGVVVSVVDCEVFGNQADDGGGLSCRRGCSLSVTDSRINGNHADDGGGGFRLFSLDPSVVTTLTIIGSTIADNTASGAIPDPLPNDGFGSGGGINCFAPTDVQTILEVSDTTIRDNVAINAGGIFNRADDGGSASMTVLRSTISGNAAVSTIPPTPFGGNAGGILNVDGTAVVANSTISGNASELGFGDPVLGVGLGGGILNGAFFGLSTLTLVNDTVTENQGFFGGGVVTFSGGGLPETVFANTIVAGNTDAVGSVSCLLSNGIQTSLGGNLEDSVLCDFADASDLVFTDPMLGPLANNGGPTRTHALLAGSPAVESGNAVACADPPVDGIDQRGVSRPQGAGCDRGAFELAARFACRDFDRGDDEGGTVDAVFPDAGFTVTGSPGPAILFDSSSPTCDDSDLATPGAGTGNDVAQGDVLIIRELGSDCVRDDERDGGTLTFDFEEPIDFLSVGILDADEEGGSIMVMAPGASPCVAAIPALDDNGWQEVSCELAGATTLIVELAGSGAVTGITCGTEDDRRRGIVAGIGVTDSGARVEMEAVAFESGSGLGSVTLSAPRLSASPSLVLDQPLGRRMQSVAPTRRAPRALSDRASRRRGGSDRDELRGSVEELVTVSGVTTARGVGSWNGQGPHSFELQVEESTAERSGRVRLTVWRLGGATVYHLDERLSEGGFVLTDLR
ncbi:MAG: choice-of-anchor Q domain-containing protein [Acidobacteriota bacterium]